MKKTNSAWQGSFSTGSQSSLLSICSIGFVAIALGTAAQLLGTTNTAVVFGWMGLAVFSCVLTNSQGFKQPSSHREAQPQLFREKNSLRDATWLGFSLALGLALLPLIPLVFDEAPY